MPIGERKSVSPELHWAFRRSNTHRRAAMDFDVKEMCFGKAAISMAVAPMDIGTWGEIIAASR